MGSGIAQTAAAAGFLTVVRDVAQPLLEKGRASIGKSLSRLVEKGKLTAATRDTALARLSFGTDLSALRDCDIIIEAVTEDLELKNGLWRELDRLCGPATIFASNTSSLTIAAMAAATTRADRFVGLHFFNPVPLMPLVEVVRTATTSTETFQRAYDFARGAGQGAGSDRGQSGVYRQSAAGSLSTRLDPCAGARGGLDRRSRPCHAAGMRPSNGSAGAVGLTSGSIRSCGSPTSCSRRTVTTGTRRHHCFAG